MSGSADELWRFIHYGALPGAYNMALDMAMTLAASRGETLPTLRIYGWKVPTISLGYHQSEQDLDLDRCREDGVDVVYRPTGGRAVLHQNEITYAVVLPPSSRYFSDHILTIYELISRCLVRGLRCLGAPVDFERKKRTPQFNGPDPAALCYASSAQYEIVIGNRKLVGSAQRRISNGVLQHGSILIGEEHLNITRYVAVRDDSQRLRLRSFMERRTVVLNQVLPHGVDKRQAALCIRDAFADELGIRFLDGEPTPNEHEEAMRLLERFSIVSSSL
ncbi:MAG: lipoate--protein ligase family protein [candidate division KSB1 bacterium]|nr:lipoate--protein ligase family protein [candidate division KSB1 bacterium]